MSGSTIYDFPAAPTFGEEYTPTFGPTFRWTGKVWNQKPPASPDYVLKAGDVMTGALVLPGDALTPLEAMPLQQATAGFVAKPGDTMTGPLALPLTLPTLPEQATHKQYVDQSIAAASLYQGPWQVAANTPDLDPLVALPQHTYSWIAQTADMNVPETAPATLPGIGGKVVGAGDTIVWNANTSLYDQIRAPASTAGYLPLVGGTLTGTLNIATGGGALTIAPAGSTAKTLQISASSSPHAGIIEFFAPDGTTRCGYMGYGGTANLDLAAEGGRNWNIAGGLYLSSGGVHWGNNSAVTGQHDLSKGICVYGYGSTSQFGWNITSGTLNHIVQNAGNKHQFVVGTENKLHVNSAGLFIPTVANDKNGYFIGDRFHGMYFHGGNTTVFTEYHDRFEWRRQTSGAAGGGDLRMSLVGGVLTMHAAQHIFVATDGYGIKFNGNAHIYKKVGEGGLLREAGGDYRWAIEGNTGTWKGWISYQASATLSVEELIEDRVAPLLTDIAALRAELAALKSR